MAKVVIVSDENCEVKVVTKPFPGTFHDKNIFDRHFFGCTIPEENPVYVDNGFDGIETEDPVLNVKKPIKKKKGKKLNGGQKLKNRLISSERVKVEHAIRGGKRYAILSEIFRGSKKSLDLINRLGFGLWNFRVRSRLGLLSNITTKINNIGKIKDT